MATELVRTTKLAKKMLKLHSESTGVSASRLVEYAILNLKYVSDKDLKNQRK